MIISIHIEFLIVKNWIFFFPLQFGVVSNKIS